jgi:chromosome segregation ATPase
MSDGDQTGRLGSLLNPLTFPRQAMNDLEMLGRAAARLPKFQLELLERMDDVIAELRGLREDMEKSIGGLREEVKSLDGGLSGLRASVVDVGRDVDATKEHVAELRGDLKGIADLLPDPNSRGPIERAKDALTGNEPDQDE